MSPALALAVDILARSDYPDLDIRSYYVCRARGGEARENVGHCGAERVLASRRAKSKGLGSAVVLSRVRRAL